MNKPDITGGTWNNWFGTIVSDKGGKRIADCNLKSNPPEHLEIHPNAKAISAVPELIDALIEAYNMADNLSKHAEFKYSISGAELQKRFKQALLKAGCYE